MATGGEVPGHKPSSGWGEDLDNIKCQPCLEDGQLHEAIGICVDCDDYLCSKCFEHHTLPRPCRNHKLLDKDQMRNAQVRASRKDTCTETCSVHEDEVTKYYCIKHRLLGCTVCITLGGHSTCENVRYIPHVAKELASNEEYIQAETQLKSALDTFNKVCENVEKSSEELESSCAEAVKSIKEYRRNADEALNNAETELIEEVQKLKNEELQKLDAISDKYKADQEELKSRITKITALQSANQNCSLYTEMMRSSEMLSALQSQIEETVTNVSYIKPHVTFSPNQTTMEKIKLATSFGKLSVSRRYYGSIVKAKHMQDICVKTGTDKGNCTITGSGTLLHGKRLVVADYHNFCIKSVDTSTSNVLSELKLSSMPWDIAPISSNKVVVTLPDEKKMIFVTVGDSSMAIDRTVDVDGKCWGVDFKNDRLAVSFANENKVKILNLHGSTLHEITTDILGKNMFNYPQHLAFSHDDTVLYVSNRSGNNVKKVKIDGTVVATYTDIELKEPLQILVDVNGDVLVCSCNTDSVHQITSDCMKIQVLLSKTDGLKLPFSMSYNVHEDSLIIGMAPNNIMKMYQLERNPT